jgi:hypothetical protein
MSDDMQDVDLDELPNLRSGKERRSDEALTFEFLRRQTKAQIESAEYAKQSVRWMFWSVVVLAAASVATFALNLWQYLHQIARG